MSNHVDPYLQQRFKKEIDEMSPSALAKYKSLVAAELVRKILSTLTVEETKCIYKMILEKQRSCESSVRGADVDDITMADGLLKDFQERTVL